MSFGFSVGDFIAAANLIVQVVSALREATGSAVQYQHLKLKLEFLSRSLQEVNLLEPEDGLQATVEAIKTTALSCQLPLLEYLESIKKNDKSLGLGKSAGVMKDVFIKAKWEISKKSDAAMKLEAEITAYLGAINLLLGLYKMYAPLLNPIYIPPLKSGTNSLRGKLYVAAEQRARCRLEKLTTTLANLQTQTHAVTTNVAQIQDQVEEGTRAVRSDIKESSKQTSQALQRLQQNCFASLSGFLKTAGALSVVTLKTYSKVSEMYNAILWIQTRLSEPDTRHTWLQDPIKFEDAYGRIIPIPAEFDYPMMEGALRGRFKEGRGRKLVERNQWQLYDASHPQTVFSAENWEPVPGMKITMAMIIPQFDDQMVCPRLGCTSKIYTDVLGGGKNCSECGTWFDNLPKSSWLLDIQEIDESEEEDNQSMNAKNGLRARKEDSGSEDNESESDFEVDDEDLRLLKNARIRLEGPRITSVELAANQQLPSYITFGSIDALPPPLPPQQARPVAPAPPTWLTSALNELMNFSHDHRFEGIMRYTAIDTTTERVCPIPPPGQSSENIKYMFVPRIRCLDCPGRLYLPGPDATLEGFEVHLRNRSHIEHVHTRLYNTDQWYGSGSSGSEAEVGVFD